MSALNFLAGAARGYMDQRDANEEKARRTRMDQVIFDREERAKTAAAREDRAAARQEQFQNELDSAGQPVVRAESGEMYSPAVDDEGNAMPANTTVGSGQVGDRRFPTMAEAQQFAAKAPENQPEAVRSRQLGVMQRYNPTAAVQMETNGLALESNQLSAKRMRQAAAVQDAQREVLAGGWNAVPAVYGRYNNGVDVSVKPDAKGGAELTFIKDGKPIGSRRFNDLHSFMREASASLDPDKYLTEEEARADKARAAAIAEREIKVKEKVADDNGRYHDGVLDINRNKVSAAAEPAPVWSDKADATLMELYTGKDDLTGKTAFDGNGFEFAKTLAVNMAKRNGGDASVAMARAKDVDDRIREAMKGDPARIRQARSDYLRTVSAPRAVPASAAGVQGGSVSTSAHAAGGGEQAGRDVEAGLLMIRHEMGGDVNAARAAVEKYQAAIAAAPNVESKQMLQSAMARLQAGIDAMTASGSVAPPIATASQGGGATAPAPARAPAAAPPPPSGRAQLMQRTVNQKKAAADPDVIALQAEAKNAKSGQTERAANIRLAKLLSDRYGL